MGRGRPLLSSEFRARNYAALEHIDLVVDHGRLGVPLLTTRLRQHGLTPTSREDQSGKRALEILCHTRIDTNQQDTTDHVSGPAKSNATWDTNFPR